MKFTKAHWHDGHIQNLQLKFPTSAKEKSKVIVQFSLFENNKYKERSLYECTFSKVSDFTSTFELSGFTSHLVAGTIQDASEKKYQTNKESTFIYTIELQIGRILIHSAKAVLKKTPIQTIVDNG